MKMRLDGKNAIVTGGASGIGRAIVFELASMGVKVAICDINGSGGEAVASQVRSGGGHALAIKMDVGYTEQVTAAVAQVHKELGPVHILVHSAGIPGHTPILQITDAQWDEMISIHMGGAFRFARAVLPDMFGARWGRIVNISSGAALNGGSGPNMCHYAAAKAGIIGLTKAMAYEGASMGVTVNAIAPGIVDTPILKDLPKESLAMLAQHTPLGRLGQPEDIAAACAYLVSEGGAFVTGQVLSPNGGILMT